MGLSDKITDGIASKIAGKKIQTQVVDLDDFIGHFEELLKTIDADEIKDIEKVVKGSIISSIKSYDTRNGKYRFWTYYAGTLRSSKIINEINLRDNETYIIYTYKSIRKGKFKKVARQLIEKYKQKL